jgi:uncharacterized protein (TIGR03086 family)
MSTTSGNPNAFELLERAIDQTAAAIGGVRPDQATLPTPCANFDVRGLVNHTVYDVQTFASMVKGGERGSPDANLLGDDWAGAFRTGGAELMAAWQARGINGTIKNQLGEFPASWGAMQHVADFAVHSWDIAVSTDQSTASFDTEVAEAALAWAKDNLKPQFRGADKAFGTEVEVAADAPAYDRLVGFFGRQPGYSASA